ncbi:MAG: DUF721 domain-containing protein [Cypionkella sp.]|nr:DUF721 domain-containing protein [Cypionkella sp.]
MARTAQPMPDPSRRRRGFEPAAGLMKEQIRSASESRGFAVARLLTHWPEIAGAQLAPITRPVKIGYGREGMGATLTLLTTSAHAPMVQMDLPRLKEKVNAVYGYNAIARILITQTAATGFAEGQAQFLPATPLQRQPDPQIVAEAARTAAPIRDDGLRKALEAMAQNVLTRNNPKKG